CLRFFQWQGWTGLFACMITEAILQMRLYALYFQNKKVLTVMVSSFIVSSASSATIMGLALSKITVSSKLINFCVPLGVPSYFFAFWIPILVFETLLCVLALARGFQTFRSHGGLFVSGRYLVSILIRDSVLYFLVWTVTRFLTYVSALSQVDVMEIPIGFAAALSCVMGNRVILNIRRANRDIEHEKNRIDPLHSAKEDSSFHIDNFVVPGPLTDIEMTQLRSLRSDRSQHSHFVVI
ncbi:hypothetical protein C8J56DRAFT_917551, partial [Mycena floridula]